MIGSSSNFSSPWFISFGSHSVLAGKAGRKKRKEYENYDEKGTRGIGMRKIEELAKHAKPMEFVLAPRRRTHFVEMGKVV